MTSALAPVDLALSPSVLHHRLADAATPALAYCGGPFAPWQAALREQLRTLLGYDQMPTDKCPLNVRPLWRREHKLGTIEKLVFTSEPGADVLCYLCLPHGWNGPGPLFICLQGHSTGMHNSIAVAQADEVSPIVVEGDRDFALGCLRQGIAALCIEQRSFGERREKRQQSVSSQQCHDAAMQALMLGRTLVGERVYDVERALEVLAQRPEVDPARIGLMGNSGGGTVTIYAAAVLPQIRWAIPSCALCQFSDSIMRIHHCADNYIPHLLRYAEAGDIVGLIAPRSVVVVAGLEDRIFPFTGVQTAYEQVQRIYHAAGAPTHCRLVVGEGGHRFYEAEAWREVLPFVHATANLGGDS